MPRGPGRRRHGKATYRRSSGAAHQARARATAFQRTTTNSASTHCHSCGRGHNVRNPDTHAYDKYRPATTILRAFGHPNTGDGTSSARHTLRPSAHDGGGNGNGNDRSPCRAAAPAFVWRPAFGPGAASLHPASHRQAAAALHPDPVAVAVWWSTRSALSASGPARFPTRAWDQGRCALGRARSRLTLGGTPSGTGTAHANHQHCTDEPLDPCSSGSSAIHGVDHDNSSGPASTSTNTNTDTSTYTDIGGTGTHVDTGTHIGTLTGASVQISVHTYTGTHIGTGTSSHINIHTSTSAHVGTNSHTGIGAHTSSYTKTSSFLYSYCRFLAGCPTTRPPTSELERPSRWRDGDPPHRACTIR